LSGSLNAAAAVAKGSDKKKLGKFSNTSVSPLELAPIPDHCLPVDVFPSMTANPISLRSQQLAAPLNLPPRSQKQLESELITLHLKKPKEFIPSTPITTMFDQLRHDILLYHSLQRYVQEREQLRDQLKVQVQPVGTSSLSALSSSSSSINSGAMGLGNYYSGGGSNTAMDSSSGKLKGKSKGLATPGGGIKEEYSYPSTSSKGLTPGAPSFSGKKLEKRKSMSGNETPSGLSVDLNNDAKRRKK
jgi:hypothetical protein